MRAWISASIRRPPVEEDLAPVVNIAAVQAMAFRAAIARWGENRGPFSQGETVTRRE